MPRLFLFCVLLSSQIVSFSQSGSTFESQMEKLTLDFPHDFIHLLGDPFYDDEDSDFVIYDSDISLEGSEDNYFDQDLIENDIRFRAIFPASLNLPDALIQYSALITKVEKIHISTCNLVKSEEQVIDNLYRQIFRCSTASSTPDYAGMNIVVSILRTDGFTPDGISTDKWTPGIDVYKD